MGCVSSKIMLKSSSFREELSKSLKRTAGYPVMENLFKSNPDEDQIFAIVCTPNKQLRPLEQQKPIDDREPTTTHETINLQDLMNGLEEEKQEQEEQKKKEFKDCVIISKKVHTVEEYDALVVTKQQEVATGDCDTTSSSVGDIKDGGKKGTRRKEMARELKTLKLDSFEFSSVGSLREWIGGGGQVGSSGSFDTPKFGKSEKDYGGGEECSDFYPNFVDELEEAIDELTMEEENIIREMLDVIK